MQSSATTAIEPTSMRKKASTAAASPNARLQLPVAPPLFIREEETALVCYNFLACERNKISQTLFRVGHGAGRGFSPFHATRRGKAEDQRLREKSLGRSRGSVCYGDG